jgi:hypothetical protein
MLSIDEKWSLCYRAKRDFRNVGIACTLLMSGMACLSIWAWCNQPPNDRVNMPGVISLFFAFTTLGIWLFLFYIRYRLCVNDAGLLQIGVIARKQISFERVNELKWRCWPGRGSVKLSELACSVSIGLDNFSGDDRDRLIAFLRNSVNESRQRGWAKFSRQFQDKPKQRAVSRRIGYLLIALVFAHAIGFFVCWLVGLGLQFLIFGLVNAVAGACFLVFHRKRSDLAGEQTDVPNRRSGAV